MAALEVEAILESLPEAIQPLAKGLPVHYVGIPNRETAAEMGSDLLGLFSGEAYSEIGETLVPGPAQIHLFLRNLWDEADGEPDRFAEEVRITYLHELGHYLGWDEDEINARGIG